MTGEFREKANLMDAAAMDRAITRLSHEILEKNNGAENVVLIGVRRRGYPLALRIAGKIKTIEGVDVPVGAMDITFYRDDLSKKNDQPVVSDTDIPFDVNGKQVEYICMPVGQNNVKVVEKTETGYLASHAAFLGLLKKALILLVVLLAALLDQAVSKGAGIQFEAVMGATCLWFIASEGLSVLENVASMGVPVPKILLKLLEIMREKGDGPKEAATDNKPEE